MNCPTCNQRAWMTNKKKSGGVRYQCQSCGHRFSIGMKARGVPAGSRDLGEVELLMEHKVHADAWEGIERD